MIAAEGEHKASRSLRLAADVITGNSAALQVCLPRLPNSVCNSVPQLRYLQTLNNISAENNSTIVFPVPVQILSALHTNTNPLK